MKIVTDLSIAIEYDPALNPQYVLSKALAAFVGALEGVQLPPRGSIGLEIGGVTVRWSTGIE